MGIPLPAVMFSFEDYLAWEGGQLEKHEFVRGETFAMAGAKRAHVTVSLNLASAFKTHLRGTPCRAYMADMKLRVEAADAGFYPDVMVSCDSRDHAADLYLSHPVLVVEVLSDSTAAYDRGDKFADYRKLPSLQEYAIVDIDSRRVECFRRNGENHWVLFDFEGVGECEFASIGLSIPLAAVFEDVEAEEFVKTGAEIYHGDQIVG
ncbi:MAG: Uma2 family endonuclease [Candidatus Methylumidiphilus sp.]